MAKDDKAKIKMTVIHFETESDSATLQENIRAITQTLTRALAPPPRVAPAPQQLTGGNGSNQGSSANSDDYVDAVDEEDYPTTSSANAPKKKNTNRQLRTPQPVDVDLTGGDVPLKVFLDEKAPEGEVKKYLAIAYWLKKYRQIEEVNADYAYTCYRHMGWQVPGDASQPFRSMKGQKYGWVKSGSVKGTYIVNHLGENEVEKMGT